MRKSKKAEHPMSEDERRFRVALSKIASLADGVRADSIDWISVGKQAKAIAQDVFRPRCGECGQFAPEAGEP